MKLEKVPKWELAIPNGRGHGPLPSHPPHPLHANPKLYPFYGEMGVRLQAVCAH